MPGDYARPRDFYGPKIADVQLAAGTQNYNGVIVPRTPLDTIFVQKIEVDITTAGAFTLAFQDTAGTPVPMALMSGAVAGPQVVDFGPTGTPLTQGASLDIRGSAAGLVGRIHIEAYQKLTGVGVPV
jgi:hypothetical protein